MARGGGAKMCEARKFVFIVFAFLILTALANVSTAKTIYVPDNYAKIQWAVDNASAGDTIVVRDGVYVENVYVDKSLTIMSENGSANCIVESASSNEFYVFEIAHDNVTISGFTIKGKSCSLEYGGLAGAGVLLKASYCVVINNTIMNATVNESNYYGIRLSVNSNNNKINNNICKNNWYGIYISSNNNIVKNNSIYENKEAGISLWGLNNIIRENKFVNNGLIVWYSYNNTIKDNIVNGKPLVYLENKSNRVVSNAGQVILVRCKNIKIEGCNPSNANIGVSLIDSDNCVILNNEIENNNKGIYLSNSNNNSIKNNSIRNIGEEGICLAGNNNTITNNICQNNKLGILIESGGYNNLEGNFILDNDIGIFIDDSPNNFMKSNIIASNNVGLYFEARYPLNNKIYLNNFNNIENIDPSYGYDSVGNWNSTSKIIYIYNGKTYTNYLGNYWSDYECEDANGDGICDSPYVIDSDNQDNYPLVKPFENYQIQEKWSFAIITDLHIGRGYPDYGGPGYNDGDTGQDYYLTERLRKVVEWINDNKSKYNIKFVIVLGDISDSGEYSEFKKAKDILDNLDIPYVPVIGNHDVWPYTDECEENASVSYFMDVFKDQFENLTNDPRFNLRLQSNIPFEPTPEYFVNYNFTYNGVNFVVLDFNSRMAAWGHGVMPWAANIPETINWLNKSLNEHKGEPAIIISHHPFTYSPSAFIRPDLREIKDIIIKSNAKVLANFAGHIHGFNRFVAQYDHFLDANTEYTDMDIFSAITTEALMVGANEIRPKGVKGVIRIVNVSDISIEYEAEKAEGEFPSLNPYLYLHSAKGIGIGDTVKFEISPFQRGKTFSYTLDWGDGQWVFGESSTDVCVSHEYAEAKTYTVNLTVKDVSDSSLSEYITRNITVKEDAKEPYKAITSAGTTAVLWNGADVTENPQNTPEWVNLFKWSEPKPVAEIYPSASIVSLAQERDIPICFGSDAHSPLEVGRDFPAALQLARDSGYTEYFRIRNRWIIPHRCGRYSQCILMNPTWAWTKTSI